MHNETAASCYTRLCAEREHYLERGRKAARLTIPSILPEAGDGPHTDYADPYQSIGARGVSNLASKLQLALLPPTSPFFRFVVPYELKEDLEAAGDDEALTEIDQTLSAIEGEVFRQIEARGLRSRAPVLFRQLLVAGNCLLDLPKDGPAKIHRLDRYVVQRNGDGNVAKIVLKESVQPDEVPEEVREFALADVDSQGVPRKNTALYTVAELIPGTENYRVWQEVGGERFNETPVVKRDKLPLIPLRWTALDGEDYGRGYCDDYIGDLRTLEGLRQAVVHASAAAAKVVWLVRPNGQTSARQITRASNGQFVPGHADDVTRLGLDKFADLSVAQNQIEQIRQDLSYAFLLNSAIQRNAERVTAEEIRVAAQELEDALGGAYSVLSSEFQLPLVQRLVALAKIPADQRAAIADLDLTITTGIESLGRGHELNRLDVFLQGAMQMLGPEVVAQYVRADEYLRARASALNLDIGALVKTGDEVQQEQQGQFDQQMMLQAAPEMMRSESQGPGGN